uniref:Putative cytochrome P450 n=1 Tax=Helianthus annuus TaxID=4232 RepID=A0A251T8E5_HELAN
MGWPLIGNMLIVEDGSTHPLWLSPLGRNGGIFHIKMGFSHTIVVSSPEMAREILQVQDHIFANRPATIAITYLTYNRVDMAFADYGPFWRQMRKLSVMKLFSRKRAESWDSVLDEVDSMVKSTLVNSGSLVNLGELVFGLTHDIISRALSGLFLMKVKRSLLAYYKNTPSCLAHSTWLTLFCGLASSSRLDWVEYPFTRYPGQFGPFHR